MARYLPYSAVALMCALLVGAAAGADKAADKNARVIKLATTTSTENSGLLRAILPAFEQSSGYRVHVIAVGTGKALRMGRDGDVDVVLAHAPEAELAFIRGGYGVGRRLVMHNDFVVVGPRADPAGLRRAASAQTAFAALAAGRYAFISRGDNSGTHKKEMAIWHGLGLRPAGSWYREAGQGMGRVLQIAGELDAYTLTDRGTWLALREQSPLAVVFEGDPPLRNAYSVIAVNPRMHDVNHRGAARLSEWLTSPAARRLIAGYRIHGEQLFYPRPAAATDVTDTARNETPPR